MCRHTPFSLSLLVISLLVGFTATPARAASVGRPDSQTGITPFSGTSTLTYTSLDPLIPAAATRDFARSQQVETFAVRDATHWRFDVRVTAPVIESHDETIVDNGSQVVEYSTLSNQAVRLPGSAAQSAFLLPIFLQSPAPLGTTAAGYRALLKRNPREKVRSLGQTQRLGRTVDVLRIAPLGWESTGSCTGAKACAAKAKGYGSTTMWIDHQTGLVLESEQSGVPKRFGGQQGFRYTVTSLTVGQGPSDADLAYVPPVTVQNAPQNSGSEMGSGSGGAGRAFQAPPGFIAVGDPVTAAGTMLVHGNSSGSGGPMGGSSFVAGVFRGQPSQGFVYVDEQTRALGLPAVLMAGNPQQASSCQVWTGTFPDGLTWLAMMRGHIAILLAANKLTVADLVRYAADGICTAPIVPPPSAQQMQDTALDHLEVEIDITRQILGTVIAAAPSAADKQTLKSFDTRLESFDKAVFAIRHRSDPQTTYSPPRFPPPQKDQFADAVGALRGEMIPAKAQLAGAEAAVQSPADRQTLQQQGTVFDDLVRAVDAMTAT